MLVNCTTGETLATRVRLCSTFWTRFRGLMFRRSLDPDEVYVFGYRRESVAETAIHMLFVCFAIAVLWLDADRRVVDTTLAKPFGLYYASQMPAQYFVEGTPGLLSRVSLGDELDFPMAGTSEDVGR